MTTSATDLELTTFADHPEHLDQLEASVEGAFPRFLLQDPIWDSSWPRLLAAWPELQVFLTVPSTGEPMAMVNAVAISWDSDPEHLPAGTHAALLRALDERDAGVAANTACAIQGVIRPDHKGRGLGRAVMRAFLANAARQDYRHCVSPIRPTAKQHYPTVPLDRYVEWRDADGLPLDPWLRVQAELGHRLHVSPDSLVIEGSIAEWQEWTDLHFPDSGDYVIPGGHVPVVIDRQADRGRYAESHVWFEYDRQTSQNTAAGEA